jgi:hypothetical protein
MGNDIKYTTEIEEKEKRFKETSRNYLIITDNIQWFREHGFNATADAVEEIFINVKGGK